jgi:hypothetical protein
MVLGPHSSGPALGHMGMGIMQQSDAVSEFSWMSVLELGVKL